MQDWPVRAFLMAGVRLQLRLLVIATTACLLVRPCLADQPKAKIRRPQMPAAAKPAQPEAAPAMPLRPEQMPATPPQVAFQHGLLTITAENSTLGDILRAVRNQTGAAVEVPANATERVAGNFGPGPARDVLSSLLNGSHFNYVLLGSATNPDALERVILTVKSGGSGAQPAAAPESASATPPAAADAPETAAEELTDQAQEVTDIFAEDPAAAQTDDQTQTPFGQPAANARTPEQMLQDLQRQQEMQQQIQQRQQQMGINPGMGPRGGLPMPTPGGAPPTQPQ